MSGGAHLHAGGVSSVYRLDTTASVTYVAIPEGRLIRGRVKEIEGYPTYAEQNHPGRPHEWHEMLHYGQPGTGFAECGCGAVGVPYEPFPADPTDPETHDEGEPA